MFLCTRQIDIHARFGIQRIAFLSLVATIFTFLVSYEVMYYFLDTPLSDRHFFVLIVFILLMYPIHKIVHLLFFLPYYKSFKTHIQEFQKRNIPVSVYAYVAAKDKKEMEKEAEEFYKAASPYKPTYYWLDVEEKTMKDMNAGVEAFRAKLQALGAKNIGLYIGTYFMEEHSISTDKFTALWIPTYGFDDGYYNAAPDTNTEYDLHQYTSQGQLNGFSHYLDLNQIAPTQDQEAIYRKLFKVQKDNSSS